MALIFFPELIAELNQELVPEQFELIDVNPNVLGGAPVVKGTRISTSTISAVREFGQHPTEAYPDLSEEQVAQAERFQEFLEAA